MIDNAILPDHYNKVKIKPIDVIEDWNLGFSLGNTVKYISRAGKKNPSKLVEDLQKAAWYLNREIERISNLEKLITEDFEKAATKTSSISVLRGPIYD